VIYKLTEDEMFERIAQIEKKFRPDAYFRYSKVSTSYFDYSRAGYDIGCRFHFNDGRLSLSPGYRKSWLLQGSTEVSANGMYLAGEGTISDRIRWSSTVSYIGYKQYDNAVNFDAFIYATLSTATSIVADYIRRDFTTEMDNLNALLAGNEMHLDSFGVSAVHRLSARGEIAAGLSEAMLSDGNGREQLYGNFLYSIFDDPLLKVGCGYKLLSFSKDAPKVSTGSVETYYWAPRASSSVGFIGKCAYKYAGMLNCELGFGMYRVLESLQVENNLEGSIYFIGGEPLTAGISFSMGKGSSGGDSDSVYRSFVAEVRYYF